MTRLFYGLGGMTAWLLAAVTPAKAQALLAPSAVERTLPAGVAMLKPGAMGAGTESRIWADAPLSAPVVAAPYTVTVTEHVKIAMRDGIKLDAVLYVPERQKPAGCILDADGYGWTLDPRDRRFAEQQGYAVLNVSLRGVFESEGAAGLYDKFGEDGYDLVEWMAKQPWCADGNVGAFGSSLEGITMWQIANTRPPHLKAVATDVACADCYNYLWFPGGMVTGPGREQREAHEYLAATRHRDRDAWWDKQIVDDKEIAAIAKSGMAVMISGGAEDYISPGSLHAFAVFHAAGGKSRLLVERGPHASPSLSVIGPWLYETHMDVFFARYLRGENNAWNDRQIYKNDVLLWIMGPDKFRWEKSWPIPDASVTKLYLRAKPTDAPMPPSAPDKQGRVANIDGSLSASPPAADEPPVVYDYFPESGPFLPAMRSTQDGWPTSTNVVGPTKKVDGVEYEAKAVSWTTAPLGEPTEITGNMVLEFSAASSAPDTDFVLLITDVAPDGQSEYLTSGFLNAPRYPDQSRPHRLVPGEVRAYKITAQPTAYVVQAGHRLRFSIAGGATPASYQTSAQGPGKNAIHSRVTILQDAVHPAFVSIPIIGDGRLSEVAAAQ